MRGILFGALSSATVLILAGCANDEPWPPAPAPAAEAPAPAPAAVPMSQGAMMDPGAGGLAPAPAAMGPAGTVSAPKSARPPLSTVAPDISDLPPFSYTQTAIAPKVREIRDEYNGLLLSHRERTVELARIRTASVEAARAYHGTTAAIEARLQQGTTPDNPILSQQWSTAQAALTGLGNEVVAMNRLSADIAADIRRSGYIQNKIAATLKLPGALDEDHRQMHMMEDALDGEESRLNNMLADVTDELQRQSAYVANEQANMQTMRLAIKNGRLYGTSLANVAYNTRGAPSGSAASVAPGSAPLIVVRFDTPNPNYEQALYNAMSRALERKPDAQFDLVAVSPEIGDPAQSELTKNQTKAYAQNVLNSITDMGLPSNRLRLSAATSARASTSEVHLYVR